MGGASPSNPLQDYIGPSSLVSSPSLPQQCSHSQHTHFHLCSFACGWMLAVLGADYCAFASSSSFKHPSSIIPFSRSSTAAHFPPWKERRASPNSSPRFSSILYGKTVCMCCWVGQAPISRIALAVFDIFWPAIAVGCTIAQHPHPIQIASSTFSPLSQKPALNSRQLFLLFYCIKEESHRKMTQYKPCPIFFFCTENE